MNGETLLDALQLVEVRYVTAADAPPRRRRHIRWGLLAACIALLGAITAVAAGDFPTRVMEFLTGHTEPGSDLRESSYALSVSIDKVPFDDLTGDIQSVPEQIQQQFLHLDPASSWWPGHWQRHYDNPEEAAAFIGYPKLHFPALTWPQAGTTLRIYGDALGDVSEMVLESDYTVEDIHLQAYACIYTESYEGDITYSTHTTEDVTFGESFYTTDSGQLCHIIQSSALNSGRCMMDGLVVEDGVLYRLHVSFPEQDAERALELLHHWAELF